MLGDVAEREHGGRPPLALPRSWRRSAHRPTSSLPEILQDAIAELRGSSILPPLRYSNFYPEELRQVQFPTCLAFAMQLANQKAKLADCPFVTEEAKTRVKRPPLPNSPDHHRHRENKIELGDETGLSP